MLLDVNLESGTYLDNTADYIKQVIKHILNTPFESRIFNPSEGTGVNLMLQEPVDDLIYKSKVNSLIIAAVERGIPYSTVKSKIEVLSSGRGTATLRVLLNISYNNNSFVFTMLTDRRGFVN